jgi:hypothetical protein
VTESTQNSTPKSKNDDENVLDELVRLRKENEHLVATLRDLTHSQLISRDLELGLRAEVVQLRIDLVHAHAVGAAEVNKVRTSTSWRVGRMITKPFGVVRRMGRLRK